MFTKKPLDRGSNPRTSTNLFGFKARQVVRIYGGSNKPRSDTLDRGLFDHGPSRPPTA